MHLTADGLAQLVASVVICSALFLAVLGATLRFAVRPFIEDWFKHRGQMAGPGLERRLADMEESIRRLEANARLQLPSDSARPGSQPRT